MVIRVCKGREQVSDANMLVIVAGLFLTISTSFCRIGFDMFQQIKSNKLRGKTMENTQLPSPRQVTHGNGTFLFPQGGKTYIYICMYVW
jgi:hypothetical protein